MGKDTLTYLHANSGRLRRVLYVNNLYAIHGYPAEDPDDYHRLCDRGNELRHYIDSGNWEAVVETWVIGDIARERKKVAAMNLRDKRLKRLFAKRGLDATMHICNMYISGGLEEFSKNGFESIDSIKDIADLATEMNFLFKHTDYRSRFDFYLGRLNRKYNEDEDNGINNDTAYCADVMRLRESCKWMSLKSYLSEGDDRSVVPKHLFKKYEKEMKIEDMSPNSL
jgi:hypothetical protein